MRLRGYRMGVAAVVFGAAWFTAGPVDAAGPPFGHDTDGSTFARSSASESGMHMSSITPHSESVKAGLRRYYKDDFDGAMAQFELALDENPADTSAVYFLGYTQYRQGHYAEARANFSRAYTLSPDFSPLSPEQARGAMPVAAMVAPVARSMASSPATSDPATFDPMDLRSDPVFSAEEIIPVFIEDVPALAEDRDDTSDAFAATAIPAADGSETAMANWMAAVTLDKVSSESAPLAAEPVWAEDTLSAIVDESQVVAFAPDLADPATSNDSDMVVLAAPPTAGEQRATEDLLSALEEVAALKDLIAEDGGMILPAGETATGTTLSLTEASAAAALFVDETMGDWQGDVVADGDFPAMEELTLEVLTLPELPADTPADMVAMPIGEDAVAALNEMMNEDGVAATQAAELPMEQAADPDNGGVRQNAFPGYSNW